MMDLWGMAKQGATNLFDGDKDGAVLDDVFKFSTKVASTLGGAALGAVGGPAGVVAGAMGGLAVDPLSGVSEDTGDFITDFFGARGPVDQSTTDTDYKGPHRNETSGEELRRELQPGVGAKMGAVGGSWLGSGLGLLLGGGPGGVLGMQLGGAAGGVLGAMGENLLSNAGGPTAPHPAPKENPLMSIFGGLY